MHSQNWIILISAAINRLPQSALCIALWSRKCLRVAAAYCSTHRMMRDSNTTQIHMRLIAWRAMQTPRRHIFTPLVTWRTIQTLRRRIYQSLCSVIIVSVLRFSALSWNTATKVVFLLLLFFTGRTWNNFRVSFNCLRSVSCWTCLWNASWISGRLPRSISRCALCGYSVSKVFIVTEIYHAQEWIQAFGRPHKQLNPDIITMEDIIPCALR